MYHLLCLIRDKPGDRVVTPRASGTTTRPAASVLSALERTLANSARGGVRRPGRRLTIVARTPSGSPAPGHSQGPSLLRLRLGP